MDESDIWVSDNSFIEEQYTKADVFQILDCNTDVFKKSNQIQAQFICLRKSEKSTSFVKEWLDLASDYDLIGPENTKYNLKNPVNFVAHRYDQSILSILTKKKGILPHITPLEIGYPSKYKPLLYRNGEAILKGEYPCCIVLQHSATIDVTKSIKTTLKAWLPKSFRMFLLLIKYTIKGCKNRIK